MELLGGPVGKGAVRRGDDFTLIPTSGSGDVTAEVVIVGHGLSDPKRDWDDYGDVDVNGKIVLIVRGSPDNGYDWSEDASRDSTLNEVIDRGATAVLWIRGDHAVNGAAIHEGVYDPDVPLAYVGKRVVDHLLYNSGMTLEQYKKKLKDAPHPFATRKELHFRTDVNLLGERTARNVLALLPGADPVLATAGRGPFLLEAVEVLTGGRDPTGAYAIGEVLELAIAHERLVDGNHGNAQKCFFSSRPV